ncbi:MAG TPA: hypothetical protein ENK39_08765 [Epsilonproteobacteria bacterium]|nr:hypothetical protein [Campylobacterota bacterium]
MKKTTITMALGFTLLGLSACTTQPKILNDTSKIPVVLQGKAKVTQNSEVITLMPAGTIIPFNLKVGGDVFMQNVQKTFTVKLRRDTYMYGAIGKNIDASNSWVSFDKKHWKTLQDAYNGTLLLGVNVTDKDTSINLAFEANSKN